MKKVAFFCEGYSEANSVIKFLNRIGIGCYELKKSNSELQDGCHGIFIHNSQGDGRLLRNFQELGKVLIEKYKYDYVIAWCDCNDSNRCPKIIMEQIIKNIPCEDSSCRDYCKAHLILLGSIKCLENWYLADINTIHQILLNGKQNKEWDSFLKKIKEKSENFSNVENIPVIPLLEELSQKVKKQKFDKVEIAIKFFSKFSFKDVKGSPSFARTIKILKKIFEIDK